MAEIDKVRALGFRDQAREKLPIFFGSRDNFLHPLRELIANGTDEINSHFDKGTIKIVHEIKDNESMITIEDSGRGLPIGEKDENGKSYLELLLLTLFAGGKYDNNAGQIGSNGVGLTVTNYTSKYFNVQSAYNGVLHEVTFTDGGNNQDYSTKKISDKKHFTRVSYVLDRNVYTGNKFSDTDIENWIKWVSAVAPKIDFEFTNSLGETTNYHYKNLENYFDEIVNSQSTSSMFKIEENDGKFVIDTTENNQYEVIFTTQAQPVHRVFLNGNPLVEDSSIDSGVINGIRLWFEKYYEGKRKQKPFTNQDIIDSVSYVVNVVSSNGEFSNQTKLSTKKALYQSQTKKIVQTILDNFRENHAVYFNRFEKHLMQVQDSNNKNSKSREKLLKKLNENVDGIKGRIDNFIDSRQHGKDSELFLTEGLSALGSVVKARNSDNQAAFPLRGKVLNVEKAGKSAIMDNVEATNILKIIGGGIGKDFDIEKSRFGKIVISSDQDDDGFQIQALLITLFNKVAQPLLTNGMVYIAKTPLYIIHFTDKDDVLYVSSENEMADIRPTLKNVKSISRVKGLGELDKETMRDTAMNPETRDIVQVTMEDVEKSVEMIENWFGSSVDYRKEYISEHIVDFLLEEG